MKTMIAMNAEQLKKTSIYLKGIMSNKSQRFCHELKLDAFVCLEGIKSYDQYTWVNLENLFISIILGEYSALNRKDREDALESLYCLYGVNNALDLIAFQLNKKK